MTELEKLKSIKQYIINENDFIEYGHEILTSKRVEHEHYDPKLDIAIKIAHALIDNNMLFIQTEENEIVTRKRYILKAIKPSARLKVL